MYNPRINESQRVLTITLPTGRKTRTVTFHIKSAEHAKRLYEINVHRHIFATLSSWLRQTEWRLAYLNAHTAQRRYALSRLKVMIYNQSEGRLETLVRHIIKHDSDFELLAPGPKSRYHQHYLTHIIPIRYYAWKQFDAEASFASYIRK